MVPFRVNDELEDAFRPAMAMLNSRLQQSSTNQWVMCAVYFTLCLFGAGAKLLNGPSDQISIRVVLIV